jgi:hypothetical protein
VQQLVAAERGDAEATSGLLLWLPNHLRPTVVDHLLAAAAPVEVLRVVVGDCWNHDHRVMLWRMGRDGIVRAFQAAQFPTRHLPEKVRVYRGGIGVPGVLRTGLAWSLSRETACWFAWRDRQHGEPVVLTGTVSRAAVLAHLTERREDEVVLAWWPARCNRVDEATIASNGERHEERRAQSPPIETPTQSSAAGSASERLCTASCGIGVSVWSAALSDRARASIMVAGVGKGVHCEGWTRRRPDRCRDGASIAAGMPRRRARSVGRRERPACRCTGGAGGTR